MEQNSDLITFEQFRKEYMQKHPASIPRRGWSMEEREYPGWLTWVVLAMFICAAILSGVHTAPTAYDLIEKEKVLEWIRQVAGLSAFGFIELGILVSGYVLFKRGSNEVFALAVLIFCIVIAIAANLFSVSRALESNDFGSVSVGVLIGIGAPVIAALTGKVFVNLYRADEQHKRRAEQHFQNVSEAFDAAINEQWEEHQRQRAERVQIELDREHKRLVSEQRKQLPATTEKAPAKTGKKQSAPDKEQVLEYLRQTENEQKSIRVAALELGVSPTMVHTLRKQLSEHPKT